MRCEDRHDRRGTAPADPDRDAAGGLPLRPSRPGADRADRAEARSAFRGDDRIPLETRRQDEDSGLGRNGSRPSRDIAAQYPVGQWMVYKVLEQGSFAWPKVQDGTMRLSRAQHEALFEGLDWRRIVAQRVAPPIAAG